MVKKIVTHAQHINRDINTPTLVSQKHVNVDLFAWNIWFKQPIVKIIIN